MIGAHTAHDFHLYAYEQVLPTKKIHNYKKYILPTYLRDRHQPVKTRHTMF